MPEGPEVKIIAEQLNKILKSKVLKQIKILEGPYKNAKTSSDARSKFKHYSETKTHIGKINALLSKKQTIIINGVHNKGKFIYFLLTRKTPTKEFKFCLASSLGLTGSWLISEPYTVPKYAKLQFDVADDPKSIDIHTILYCDKLSMGKFYIESITWLKAKLVEIGPDVLDNYQFNTFCNISSKTPIYTTLVDQEKLSGIGNYLRAEILYDAERRSTKKKIPIDPFASFASLTNDQKLILWKSIVKIASASYNEHGVSDAKAETTYHDIFGQPGNYKPKIYQSTTTSKNEPIKTIRDSENRAFWYVDINDIVI